TPEGMQGRVISAVVTMMGVTAPLGPLLAGALIGWSGRAAAFGTFAALVAAATSGLLASRALRDMPTPIAGPPQPASELQAAEVAGVSRRSTLVPELPDMASRPAA